MTQHDSPIPNGVIPPVVTALDLDGDLDLASQEAVCARQLDAGAHGIFVAGTTGEGAFLTPELLDRLVDAVIGFVAGQVPVLVGALSASTSTVVATARRAEKAGADGIVATTPFYGDVSSTEIAGHFRVIAEATTLPVLAYSIPPMTHQAMPLAAIEEMFAAGTVVGLKDSGRDWDALAGAIDLGERYGKKVYSGYEPFAGRAVAAGAAGVVASVGNVDPDGIMRLWQTAQEDGATMVGRQEHIDALVAGFSRYQVGDVGPQSALISGIKAALQELGVIASRAVLSPLTPLPEQMLPEVRAHLAEVGMAATS